MVTASYCAVQHAVYHETMQSKHELTIQGTRFLLNGSPFPFTGLSFFNAIYNPEFNRDQDTRRQWMVKFASYGINVLRLWCQWDSHRGLIDTGPECSLYFPDGRLRENRVAVLQEICDAADELGMVIQIALFSQESWHDGVRLEPAAADRAVAGMTEAMRPWRNVAFQVWNEFAERVLDHVATIRAGDPRRLVSNSSVGADGIFYHGRAESRALDFLTPHTARQIAGRHWDIAPTEVAYLLAAYQKPVVDDEPARNGTPKFGGPADGEQTSPYDQILQIVRMWNLGAYVTYHHDMFQTPYGTPAVPDHGIPDPEFNPYHRQVLEFFRLKTRYMKAGAF
jgi:hypothetical protein